MTLMRRNRSLIWDPFRGLETLQEEMNRFLSESSTGWSEGMWNPQIDIVDEKDHLVVKADIPGMSKDEIQVTVEDDNLILKGEKKHEEKTKDKNFIREERSYGAFYRSIPLPAHVKADGVKAFYKNGVLELEVPQKEESKPKQINIEVKQILRGQLCLASFFCRRSYEKRKNFNHSRTDFILTFADRNDLFNKSPQQF